MLEWTGPAGPYVLQAGRFAITFAWLGTPGHSMGGRWILVDRKRFRDNGNPREYVTHSELEARELAEHIDEEDCDWEDL